MSQIRFLRTAADGSVETDQTADHMSLTGLSRRTFTLPTATTDAPSEKPATTKEEATVIASAALAGFSVNRLADGGYVISKWNLCRHVETLDDVRTMLARAGVAA